MNPTLKFKTIVIKKSQLLLKALYLEATLTFLRFAAKHCSIAQLLGHSYQLYGAMLHIPNSAEGNCLKEKENHTLCLKSGVKSKKIANYQNIIVGNQGASQFDVSSVNGAQQCAVVDVTIPRRPFVFDQSPA